MRHTNAPITTPTFVGTRHGVVDARTGQTVDPSRVSGRTRRHPHGWVDGRHRVVGWARAQRDGVVHVDAAWVDCSCGCAGCGHHVVRAVRWNG